MIKIAFHNRQKDPVIGPYIFLERLISYLKTQEERIKVVRNPGRFHHLNFINITGSRRRANQWKAKKVLRLDGIYHDLSARSGRRNRSIRETYHAVDGIIFQCDFARRMVYKYFGKPAKAKHETIIHNGVDNAFTPEGPAQDYGFDYTIVVSGMAWNRTHKRLSDMIECFLALDRKDVGLVVLGIGQGMKQVQHPRIRYCGRIPPQELPSYYRGADLMLHLAYVDWCPNVVVEALACGVPVITTHNGGVPELIQGSGIVIKNEPDYDMEIVDFSKLPKIDPNLVAEAINIILEDPQQFIHDRPDLSIEHCGEQYLEFFKKVVADE